MRCRDCLLYKFIPDAFGPRDGSKETGQCNFALIDVFADDTCYLETHPLFTSGPENPY
jgi:hypothetical protein